MTAAQGRLADTIDVFYGAADKASEGAMAAHAYKRAVDDLDTGVGRELVCTKSQFNPSSQDLANPICIAGRAIQDDCDGTPRQDERIFSCGE